MSTDKILISKKTEEKRLEDFKKLAENWDNLPEYVAGKLDGTISAFASIYLRAGKKAG